MDSVIYFSVLIAFLLTFFTTLRWIPKAMKIGLRGLDMNKPGKPEVAEMGGICAVFGFVAGVLFYVGIKTFYFQNLDYTETLAALCTILMMMAIGMMDDFLGWMKGLKQWQKPFLTLFAAMPMMVINAGNSTMNLPLIGSVDLGILYPLVIIPIGIVGASNSYNMLAGYNGLEAGMGIIILSTLGYIAFQLGETNAGLLAFCMIGALLAFIYFNWYPARVFPGDTLTYSVGALAACVAILGNMEKIGVILFIPYAIDFFLPLRKGLDVEAFAKTNDDGSLEQPYDKICDITHLAIAVLKRAKTKVYERDVVLFVLGMETIIAAFTICTYAQ